MQKWVRINIKKTVMETRPIMIEGTLMGKPYHKIIFSYVKSVFSYILYGMSKGCKSRIKDYINFNEASEIQERYDDKKVMNTALNEVKTDYEENNRMEKLITELKRNNYKYKDDSAEMESL